MTAQPIEVLSPTSLSIQLPRIPVIDDATCAQAMENVGNARRLLKAIKTRREAREYPHKKAIAEIKAEERPGEDALQELIDYEAHEVAQYTEAKADFAPVADAPVKIESTGTQMVYRKVNKVKILNKEKVPEQFKIVDEDKIIEAYERLGTVPFGVSADGSYEIYEETITTLRRKY